MACLYIWGIVFAEVGVVEVRRVDLREPVGEMPVNRGSCHRDFLSQTAVFVRHMRTFLRRPGAEHGQDRSRPFLPKLNNSITQQLNNSSLAHYAFAAIILHIRMVTEAC